MKRTMLIIASLLLPLLSGKAQGVTYNHDETKMNQVTVMETGAGTLVPELFYSVIHNRYYKNAASTNKLRYRSEAASHAASQVGIAETVDTSLTRRAEVEALNMADRQLDFAWQAEGPKITSRLEAFRRNIGRITEVGGSPSEADVWMERYHLFETALGAIRNSYMPNAERKKQYHSKSSFLPSIFSEMWRLTAAHPSAARASHRTKRSFTTSFFLIIVSFSI